MGNQIPEAREGCKTLPELSSWREECATCVFWRGPIRIEDHRETYAGQCVRMPPSVAFDKTLATDLGYVVARAPITLPQDWCGEWRIHRALAEPKS